MFYFFNVLGYIIYPKATPFISNGTEITPDIVNEALLFTILGVIILPIGFKFGLKFSKYKYIFNYKYLFTRNIWVMNYKLYFIFSILFLILDILIKIDNPAHFVGGMSSSYSSLRRLISFQPFMFIGTVYLVSKHKKISKNNIFIIILPIVIYIISQVLLGSRSEIIFYIIFLLTVYYFVHENLFIERNLLLYILLICITAVMLFPVGYLMRDIIADMSTSQNTISINDLIYSISIVYGRFTENIYYIFKRLAYLDHLVLIVNGPLVNPSSYTGIAHIFKGFINSIVPGDVFPGVIDGMSTFPIIYLNISKSYLMNYHKLTMPWQVFGITYFYFGWLFSVIGYFVIGFLMAKLMYFIVYIVPKKYFLFSTIWAFSIVTNFFHNFGVDGFFANMIYQAIPFIIYLPILKKILHIKNPA